MKRLQIMFMSMGEPMLNLKALTQAIRLLYLLYPNAALLISTSGPDVDYGPLVALAQEVPTVGLQFSVHESTDEARNLLIPFKKKLTLDQIRQSGTSSATSPVASPTSTIAPMTPTHRSTTPTGCGRCSTLATGAPRSR
jgi:adenine C2-methylase RlmN of 23S rRNA A2503 and tRNA A37